MSEVGAEIMGADLFPAFGDQPARHADLWPRAYARRTDPETSHEAAKSVRVRPNQQAVLTFLEAYGPMSDEELVDRYTFLSQGNVKRLPHQSPSGLRTRRSELVELGKVEWTGGFIQTKRSNRKARLWQVAARTSQATTA